MITLQVIVIVALLATVGALATGIASMAHGEEFDRRHSAQLMFTRVGLQGLTLVLLILALLFGLK
jgi:hypothetical protein